LGGGAAVLSVLAACQQAAPAGAPTQPAAPIAPTQPVAPTSAAKPAATTAPAVSTQPAAKPTNTNPDAKVVVAQATDVTTLDPNSDTVITNRNVHMNMFDTLIERDHDMRFKPGLALAWEAVDPTTWKFTLRKDVKFHDGSPFSAADVKYTIDRIKGTELGSKMTLYVDAVTDATVVDDYTVTIKTKDPYPLMETRFSAVPIVGRASVEKAGLAEFARNPVGTGPFKFVEWQKDQRVTMERFDTHWRGKAGIKTLVFRPLPEPAVRVSEALTGGIDVAVRPPTESVEQLRQGGLLVKGVPSVRLVHGIMDMSKKPFDDKRVRQAFNYAVDVDGIIKSLLGGHAYRATQPVDPLTFGYSPDIPAYPFDPAKAKQLLTEAGVGSGLEVAFETPTTYKQIAEVISQQLAQVGVKATIVTDEPSVQIRKVTDKKIEPFFLFS
jgi:peptide/nickel transport system substrate-binding protein